MADHDLLQQLAHHLPPRFILLLVRTGHAFPPLSYVRQTLEVDSIAARTGWRTPRVPL
jgi:hypothetical protein